MPKIYIGVNMKKLITMICLTLLVLIFVPSLSAQSYRGQSINGSTGLYSIPTGRIGWETSGNFGLDFGYRAIINNDAGITHIPALTASLFRRVEISAAFDFQPALHHLSEHRNEDILLGLKVKLPTANNTAIALGGNFQLINFIDENNNYNAFQPYLAITYPGNFFRMVTETTVVFGKTIYTGGPRNSSNIDFGIGFDLILFPDVFGDAVHWIIDFANFGYSDNSWPHDRYFHTNAVWRGVINTGFRIDMSTIPNLNRFKFIIDLIFNDIFDAGDRSFTIGTVLGFSG
jgi:hypothetical protein